MFTFLRFGPLLLGTLLLVSASLGCSFWFFYSFLGTDGPNQLAVTLIGFDLPLLPMVAGCVGCGAQLFVYSFAANLSHIRDYFFKAFLIVISTMTIGLSMFSTYSTLISFLENKSQTLANSEFVTEQRQKIIESRTSDMSTNSMSAEQAISDKYRTQSKGLTESNEALRAKQLAEINDLTENTINTASPLDGLVRVVGNDSVVATLFCAWLAITFDLLPILGISLLGRLAAERRNIQPSNSLSHGVTKEEDIKTTNEVGGLTENIPCDIVVNAEPNLSEIEDTGTPRTNGHSIDDETIQIDPDQEIIVPPRINGKKPAPKPPKARSMDENTETLEEDRSNKVIREIIDKKPVYSDLPDQYQKTKISEVPTDVLYPVVTKYLSEGAIPISYAGVMEFTGLSKSLFSIFFNPS